MFWDVHAKIQACVDPKEKEMLIETINRISQMILSRAMHDG
jgi:hypothetical protein